MLDPAAALWIIHNIRDQSGAAASDPDVCEHIRTTDERKTKVMSAVCGFTQTTPSAAASPEDAFKRYRWMGQRAGSPRPPRLPPLGTTREPCCTLASPGKTRTSKQETKATLPPLRR